MNEDFAVTLVGLDEAFRILNSISSNSEKVMARTMYRIAALNRDAIRLKYTPRSPTIEDTKAGSGAGTISKTPSNHKRVHPGGLERAIEFASSAQEASIYVAANSEAGAYAFVIHELKGIKWHKRGLGTISKGPKADDDFIPRGIVDHATQSFAILSDAQTKALKAI